MSGLETKWIDIEGYEGMYQISNSGDVKSLSREVYNGKTFYKSVEKILIPTRNHSKGYLKVMLCKEGKCRIHYIHRLVAHHFISPIPNGLEVNRIDEDNLNNSVDNLEIVTPRQNKHHGTRIERCALGHKKPVEVTFPNGNRKQFNSVKDTYGKLGVSKSSISKCLSTGKPCKGIYISYIK